MSKALLYDATMCIGCKQCEQACATENKLPYNEGIAAEAKQSDHKYTAVLAKDDKFMRRLCMNCQDPACASACPVAALRKTAAGPVIYDEGRCMGCRYCMLACPFNVPKYEWGKMLPKVRKCTMCPDRVAAGKQTACAEICPTGATKFGERDDLIKEAQQRIRDNPSPYVKHIYGHAGQAFFDYFTRVVEHAMRTKAIADLLARAGIDPKSGMAGIGEAMRGAVGALLDRAQQAGAVRPDLRMPELMAILTAVCMAAEHSQWDTQLRARTLAIVFDGLRPPRVAPAMP